MSAATIYSEVEPNNSLATANLIASHDGSITIYGSRIGDNSADYFRFPAVAGDTLTATVCCTGDPMLALFDPGGVLVVYDDDSGPGWMPYLSYPISSSGLWTIAVTGYADYGFSGGGSSGWDYTATITLQHPADSEIPEPATWGLLAAGLAVVLGGRGRR
ncbi:MAG: PEP-CTERM sorting domain-containing protein [Bryobacteraceae bacterium]